MISLYWKQRKLHFLKILGWHVPRFKLQEWIKIADYFYRSFYLRIPQGVPNSSRASGEAQSVEALGGLHLSLHPAVFASGFRSWMLLPGAKGHR